MVFSKIKVGKSALKRSKFNKSRDFNTTSNFGFMQPCFKMEMLPNSKAVVKFNTFCRLMPMVLPTFGRVQLRYYHQFVPMHEICKQFESVIAKTPYRTEVGSYTPTDVPTMAIKNLTLLVLNNADVTVYLVNNVSNLTLGSVQNATSTLAFLERDLELYKSFEANIKQTVSDAVTLDSADFVYEVTESQGLSAIICFRLNNMGKNLRKILLGLGFVLNLKLDDRVSLLPLFAYYKAWFDIFAIQRNTNWESENLYTLINYSYQHNFTVFENLPQSFADIFDEFIDLDLAQGCYYVDDNDYLSVHQLTPTISSQQFVYGNSFGTLSLSEIHNNTDQQPRIPSTDNISQFSIDALRVLTTLVNKRSIFGKKLQQYLRDEFNMDADDHLYSNAIGQFAVNLNISDVMNMAETANSATGEGDVLGSFAGQGSGSNTNETESFEAKCFGYWISMFTVVPQADYCQGLDQELTHVNYDTFYHPEFDSLSYQITPKSVVYSNQDAQVISNGHGLSGSFGFIPRLMEYKTNCAQSIVSGDLSLRSTRNSMIPFTLDKFITPGMVTGNRNADGSYSNFSFKTITIPTDPSVFRYVGRYPYLNNFDRIFTNLEQMQGQTNVNFKNINDQFVCHNYIDVEYYAPMVPISESYDVASQKDNEQTVDKA